MDPYPYTPTQNEAYILKYLLSYAWLSVMTLMVEGDECSVETFCEVTPVHSAE